MNKRIFTVIVASVGMIIFFACNQTLPENIFPTPEKNEKTGKWGYVYDGKTIIKHQYDEAGEFSSGLANVKLNEAWGYIDKTGKETIPFKYDFANNFMEDMAKVGLNGKSGFIDKEGKEIIPVKYNEIGDFTEGVAKVGIGGKSGFIDKKGTEIIPVKYDEIGDFTNGMAKVGIDGKYGFIDKEGKEIIPVKYEEAGKFKDDWLKVKLNGKYGYVDQTGKTVIPFIYDSSVDLSLVKTILFKGGSCEYYPEGKGSWLAGENTYILNLKFTLEKNAGKDAIADVYKKGKVVAPDGKRYESGTVLSKDNVYDLWYGIPDNVNRGKLIFVYNNQVLLLKK